MNELRQYLAGQGAALIGVADLAPVDEATRQGFPRAVSFAMALTPRIVAGIANGPTKEYREEYDRLNKRLSSIAQDLAALLTARGWKAHARPASGDIDWEALRSVFSHKMAATLAGLGWIGKSDLLVTPDYGSALRWCSVLTDAPLPAGTPVTESRCGDCMACTDICPGRACSGRNWRRGMAREEFWDARACLEGMRKVNEQHGTNFFICGMCIAACPFTRAYLKREKAIT